MVRPPFEQYSNHDRVVCTKLGLLSLTMTVPCIRKRNIKQLQNTAPPLAVTNKVGFGNNALVKYIFKALQQLYHFLCVKK